MKRLFLTIAVAVLLTGCRTPQNWVRTEVYFGLSKPDGSLISASEWQAFLDEIVTPHFPSGLSVIDVRGQWRDRGGEIDREPTKMLILLHPGSARTETEIDQIRQEYCQRFSQEAVMKVTAKVRVKF